MGSSPVLSGDTSTDACFEWARNHISKCEDSHVLCGKGRNVTLPTRLLHLEPIEREGKEGFRLALTTGKLGTYACLSHCWGKDPMPARTLKSNLARHLDFIPYSSLPATFRDAVQIARQLGLEYLWIDSLCIIQDCEDDWEAEAARMAAVYGGALVTIAAVASKDFRGGCFSRNQRGDFHQRILRPSQQLSVVIGVRDHSTVRDGQPDIGRDLPLLSRAWVYQERMLSRRLLYCTRHELQLLCRETKVCQCGGNSAIHAVEASKMYPTAKRKQEYAQHIVARMNPGQGRFQDLEAALHWHKAVSEYTKLQLTCPGDKLPALAGCVRDISSSIDNGGDYLAGLWRNTLARDLLWEIHPQANARRPPEWRAPSWSWASLDVAEGVSFVEIAESSQLQHFAKKVTAATCTPKGQNVMGSLCSASLELRTNLYRLPMRRLCATDLDVQKGGAGRHVILESPDMTISRDDLPVPWHCKFDDCGPSLWDGAIRVMLNLDIKSIFSLFDWIKPQQTGCSQTTVFLLHVCDSQVRRAGKEGVDYFLALRKLKGVGECYERVGLLRVIGEQKTRQRWLTDVLAKDFGSPEHEITLL